MHILSKVKINLFKEKRQIDFLSFSLLSFFFLLFFQISSYFISLRGLQFIMLITFFLGILIGLKNPFESGFFKAIKWIVLTLLMLFLYLVFDYGDSASTVQLILSYLLPLSVCSIAYFAGLNNRFLFVKKLFLYLLVIIAVFLLPFLISGFSIGNINKEYANELYSNDSSLVVFWPFLFILSTFIVSLTYFSQNRRNKKIILLYTIIVFSIALSAFTAAFMLMLLTFFVYYLIIASHKKRLKMFFTFTVSFFILYFILSVVGSGYFGELGGSAGKIKALLGLSQLSNTDSSVDLLNKATSGRWNTFEISIKSYLSSPIFGLGYSWESFKFNPISSQHSSIFDNFAYFGLFSVLILMIYYSFLVKSYRLIKLSSTKDEFHMHALVFSLLISYVAINFFNPYFRYQLTNHIVFFIGGWVAGYLRYKERVLLINYSRV